MMPGLPQGNEPEKTDRVPGRPTAEYPALVVLLAWLPPLSLLFLTSSRTRRVATWSLLAWLHLVVVLTLWFLVAALVGTETTAGDRFIDLLFFWFLVWVMIAAAGVLLVPVWFLVRRRPLQIVQWSQAYCLAVEDQRAALEQLCREWDRLGVSYRRVGPAVIAVWPLIERSDVEDRVLVRGAVAVGPGCSEVSGLVCVALRAHQQGSRLAEHIWHSEVERFVTALGELCGALQIIPTTTQLPREVAEALTEAAASASSVERAPERPVVGRLAAVAAVATVLSTALVFQFRTASGVLAGVMGLLGGVYALVIMWFGWWTYQRERVKESLRLNPSVLPSWVEGWQSLRLLAPFAVIYALLWIAVVTLYFQDRWSQESDTTVRQFMYLVLLGIFFGLLIGAGYGTYQGRKRAR